MRIQISDHFTYSRLVRFCVSPIIMMVFTSIYSVVDGLFVSNFVGKTAFASTNLVYPFLGMMGGVGFMVGAGGCALVGKTLGEGKKELANRYFSMMVILTVILGVSLSTVGIIFLPQICRWLGADANMMDNCVLYGRIILVFTTAFMLQNLFQNFLALGEKPKLGLVVTITAGVTNMILDALFVAVFKWGVAGAALATGLSQFVGGAIPLIYFLRPNKSLLRLTKTRLERWPLVRACTNGFSELLGNISASFVSMLYNFQLMRMIGEDGVAAYGVMMYLDFVFVAIFIGYTIGSSPIVSYHYGANDTKELNNLLKKSFVLMAVAGVMMTSIAFFAARPLARIFVGYDENLTQITIRAIRIFSLCYILAGCSIFTSSFFTALNNGVVSATISFLRTMVFQAGCIMLLPLVLGIDGIWWAITVADAADFILSISFLFGMRKRYHYF